MQFIISSSILTLLLLLSNIIGLELYSTKFIILFLVVIVNWEFDKTLWYKFADFIIL